MAGHLTGEEAEERFREAFHVTARIVGPVGGGITSAEADGQLERAVACKSRINEIDGLDCESTPN